jgi:hypothetical protein
MKPDLAFFFESGGRIGFGDFADGNLRTRKELADGSRALRPKPALLEIIEGDILNLISAV